ncbi:MAG: pyridoxamine 5'-phosphate oxidase family protein [Pyrinomonadaceae bacterium]
MIKVEDMPLEEMQALLRRVGFGHLGCVGENGRPYVVPIHYAYDSEFIYIFTTEGMKTNYIEHNPLVCLQVEEVQDAAHWLSVMVNGSAERIVEPTSMEQAMRRITESNPTLTPAINATQIDAWGRANTIAVYRIRPEIIDGRKTV